MIRLGVVGYGNRADVFLRNALLPAAAESSGLTIAGIVSHDEAEVRLRLPLEYKNVSFYSDIEKMLSLAKLDALFVGTRCNSHAEIAIELLKYGLPIFLEKPVAISMEQALALEDAAFRTDTPVLVSFPLRASPLCGLAREILRSGAVGTPLHILTHNYVPYGTVYWERFYRNYALSGGLFLQKASDEFDVMMNLMNSTITRVGAMKLHSGMFGGDKPDDLRCSVCEDRQDCLESPGRRKQNQSGGSLEDHPCVFSVACGTVDTGTNEEASNALLEFQSGAQGVFTQVFFSRRDAAKRGSIISGYEGTLDFDWLRNDLVLVKHHSPFTHRVLAGESQSHFGGDLVLAHNFVNMIVRNEAPLANLVDGLRSVYVCLAAREAAQTASFRVVRQPGQL